MNKLSAALVATVALAAVCGSASAQPELIANPRGIVQNFDISNVGPILTEMGAVWQQAKAPSGQSYMQVAVGDNLVLNIIPTACQGQNNTGCVGMNTVAFFTGADLNYQTITAFNQRYWFSTAGISEDGESAYISRYDIADYGIARGNVAASIVNLVVLAGMFRDELTTGTKTVSLEGYAEDMSARLLNGRGLSALGASTPHITRHQAALEETNELIQVLMKDRDAPQNKIRNVTNKK
ncbi:MAG: hypothetical protein HXY23_11315 [Parvularculaceae bacterium]|nr:hypothetical protein [Parvularculaceae bacterium]